MVIFHSYVSLLEGTIQMAIISGATAGIPRLSQNGDHPSCWALSVEPTVERDPLSFRKQPI